MVAVQWLIDLPNHIYKRNPVIVNMIILCKEVSKAPKFSTHDNFGSCTALGGEGGWRGGGVVGC